MSTSHAQKTENGVLICPYLATSCPLLKPFAAAFSGHDDGSNSNNSNDGRPSPSACASAHSSPNTQTTPAQGQQQQQSTYDAFGGPSVPIHSLHASSGFDNQGSYRQQMQQQQQEQQDRGRKTGSPTLDGSSNANFPSASYSCRPVLNSNDSTATSVSTLSASSSAQIRRQPGSLSPSREYNTLASNNRASSSSTPYSTTLIHGNEPPTPNSFLRSPPTAQGVVPHLQQPVFPHHQQQEQQRRQEQQIQQQQQQQGRYDPSEDPYATFTSSANYVDGRDYSNGGGGGVGPYSGGGGPYGTFNTEDIEDISFNRQPQPAPQTFQPMQIPEPEERKVFASLEEVHESNGQQKEEVVGEQTAFISKLWHLLSHPEYARYLKWSKDGQAFILTNSNEFAIKVLPRFFRHSNVASFVRQLNLYSFQRVSTIRLLDMADSSTSTSINPSHGPGPHPPPHNPHVHQPFGPDSDSEDHHSSHSGGSPGPGNVNGTTDSTVTASGFTHPHFQRDHPELLKLLKPRGSTRKQASSSVASKKAAAAVRDEEERRGGPKRAGSSSGGKRK